MMNAENKDVVMSIFLWTENQWVCMWCRWVLMGWLPGWEWRCTSTTSLF